MKIFHAFKRGPIFFIVVLVTFFPSSMLISGQETKFNYALTLNTSYPILNSSTFFGGNSLDYGSDIAIAFDGSCYFTGETTSKNFPTKNAFISTYGGYNMQDSFLTKFHRNGSLLWSTYLGGRLHDMGTSIAVDDNGACFVTGGTLSKDFPVFNAYQNTTNGEYSDAFIAKFSTNGSLLWSTFFGGDEEEEGREIAIANDGSCYVTGLTKSINFPTFNAYDNTSGYTDAFLSKFSTNGSLLWSTFLGGSGSDEGNGIAIAIDGSCYVIGRTNSEDFPIKNAYDNSFNGGFGDVFVSKFSANGTYLGGNDFDQGYSISVTNIDDCYLTGFTSSSDFPILGVYNSTFTGGVDVFITKFSANGLLLWSTFFGGSENDYGFGIDVADDLSCYVSGSTRSMNFPIRNAYDDTLNGDYDAFVAKFSDVGSVLWSTYLGGSSVDTCSEIAITNNGSCYIIGGTQSSNFPVQNAYNCTISGYRDIFVSKFIESTRGKYTSYYAFLSFILIIPIVIIILWKRSKRRIF